MLSICEQQKVFEKFCNERYGENGCQTSKTISREKGQKIIRLLQNDPAAEAYNSKFSPASITVRRGAQVSAAFVTRRELSVLPNAMGVVNATTTLSLLMTVVTISPKERNPREGTARAKHVRQIAVTPASPRQRNDEAAREITK